MVGPNDDERRNAILDAAFTKFAAYGFDRTSMADIAEAAGMSRPALYQHFANKEAIFREMLGRILEGAADKALAALETEVDLAAQLDGFLQRWTGDLTEQMRSTEHGGDIVEAKGSYAKPVYDAVSTRIRRALRDHLAAAGVDEVGDVVDLLLLAPLGFKADAPSTAKLRRRLQVLAGSVASSVD
ncbi:MAG: helix-turn-helix domain-containing protein [Actinomycetota bacterium]